MLNLLIANKKLQNSQDLLNSISQYIPNIRVAYLAKNGDEILRAIKRYHFDIIVSDYEFPDYNWNTITEKMSEYLQNKYAKSIIFLIEESTLLEDLNKNDLVFDSFFYDEFLSKIVDSLKKLIDTKKDSENTANVRVKIINELQNIGYNLSHNGTHYIAESVLLIAAFKYDSENLSKTVYPKVSQIYNKDLNNIKTNIITATDAAYKNMNKEIIKKYLKIPDNIKPTAKMVINTISKKLE